MLPPHRGAHQLSYFGSGVSRPRATILSVISSRSSSDPSHRYMPFGRATFTCNAERDGGVRYDAQVRHRYDTQVRHGYDRYDRRVRLTGTTHRYDTRSASTNIDNGRMVAQWQKIITRSRFHEETYMWLACTF